MTKKKKYVRDDVTLLEGLHNLTIDHGQRFLKLKQLNIDVEMKS